jgi:glutamate synthase (NADPH/NADH) small chain
MGERMQNKVTEKEAKKAGASERSKRVPMPKQRPEDRARNFYEVALGYNEESALKAAKRCLQCPKPPCREGCPVEIDIPAFIKHIVEQRYDESIRVLKKYTNLAGVCGRVCPAEDQCEFKCVLAKIGAPVNIGYLERFAADKELEKGPINLDLPPSTGKKIAVVGSGPAGVTAAGDLAKLGHEVTLFEGLHRPGGVLVYGIPEFRLPKRIVQYEVDYLKHLGVKVETNFIVGRTMTIDELFEMSYDAIFMGVGAGTPDFLQIPGENLGGVYSANEFLTRSNLMKAYKFPETDTPINVGNVVAVIGGGNVTMDAARTALRLGAKQVIIVYRRSEAEMPARPQEVENAREEGVKFQFLTNPVRMIGNEKGQVKQLECIRMELGEPDASGRRRPIPISNSNFIMDVDTVIVAIGSGANPIIRRTARGVDLTEEGHIIVNPDSGRTSREGVWAGGDIVTGEATVISAMGAGKRAAKDIHQWLMKEPRQKWKSN